jgi:hypothetical protein
VSETKLVKEILLALGNEPDFICWRNNTGKLADVNGRWVTYGLGVGSADIIGVLAPWGRFVAIEVKTPKGKSRPAQEHWCAAVQKKGGEYFIARSADDARQGLDAARRWMKRNWEEAIPF